MNRLLISAAHKSSGKTTITIGLCAALHARNLKVQSYKKGPDYIDPMWLSRASNEDCHNLDFQTMPDDEILAYIAHYSANKDISIIEGNKGLFDGVALDGSNSNAALAELTETPVILVIDTQGMTRGIAPLLLGYQAFNEKIKIAGVILNKVGGPRHEQKLRDVINHYTDIPVIGAIPKLDELNITERHLGLVPSNEHQDTAKVIETIAHAIEKHVDLDLVIKLSQQATTLPKTEYQLFDGMQASTLRIGVARDAAFGFYYPGDLNALVIAGAKIIEFDTLHDKKLPDVDALFIGGGFPESWAKELSTNSSLRTEIRNAIERGMPVYAECGGLMYLCKTLTVEGLSYDMVGAYDAEIEMHNRPLGRGYIQLKRTPELLWESDTPIDTEIYAHEFHYSGLKNIKGKYSYAYTMQRGSGIDGHHDGLIYKNTLANYAHLRDTAKHHWAREFVTFIHKVKSENAL